MGLKHEITAGKGKIAGQPRALGARRFLHHLNQNLLARLQQLGDASGTFFQAKRTKIRDVDETILFTFSDIDEGSINTRQNIFNIAEVNICLLYTSPSPRD